MLLPQWDVIRPAVRQLLGQADLSSESAVLSVQNGTDTPGLALRTAEQMRGAGFTVPDSAVGNPPDGGGGAIRRRSSTTTPAARNPPA